jgi:phosphoserine phosphatase RsbU/P
MRSAVLPMLRICLSSRCVSVNPNPSRDAPPGRQRRRQTRHARVLDAIFDVNEWFAGTRDLDEILNLTAKRIADAMDVHACGIRLLDQDTDEMMVRASYNLSDSYLNKGPVLLHENPIDSAAMAGESVYIKDASKDPRVRYPEKAKAEGLVSGLCVPMTYRGNTVGVLRVYSSHPQRFSMNDEALLRGAGSQAAAGIIQARFLAEQHEAERYWRQMRYAGEIQRRMIPSQAPDHPLVTFGSVYTPSLELGGDFFDYVEHNDGRVGLAIADVVGKGIPAALIMASVRSLLRAVAEDRSDIASVVAQVNSHLCRDTLPGEFVTLFYCTFSADARELEYVSAGHDPPLLLRGQEIVELNIGGIVLGVLPCARYERAVVTLNPGDLIVFYTDGVVDAMNFEGETFGRERLRESLFKHRSCGASEIAHQIKWDTRRFAGLAHQTDDITVVAAKIGESVGSNESAGEDG